MWVVTSCLYFFSPVLMFVLSTPTSFYPKDAIDLRSFSINEIWCSLHSSAFASTPTVVMNPEGISCPLWLRPEHSQLLVLPENVIRTPPPHPFPPLCLAFLFFSKDPVGKRRSLAILQWKWLYSYTKTTRLHLTLRCPQLSRPSLIKLRLFVVIRPFPGGTKTGFQVSV